MTNCTFEARALNLNASVSKLNATDLSQTGGRGPDGGAFGGNIDTHDAAEWEAGALTFCSRKVYVPRGSQNSRFRMQRHMPEP